MWPISTWTENEFVQPTLFMEGDQILGGNEATDFPHSNAWYKYWLSFRFMFLTTTIFIIGKHNSSVFITQILILKKSQKRSFENKQMDDAILLVNLS
jgi:hypothetical protein